MIADFIRWACVRPTRDEFDYPDHYDPYAYMHALNVAHQPIPWRWPIALVIRIVRRFQQ